MELRTLRLRIAGAELPLALCPGVGFRAVTSFARSMPSRPAKPRAALSAAASSVPARDDAAILRTLGRRMRVSLRVSIPAMATTLLALR